MDTIIIAQPIVTTFRVIKLENGNIPSKINSPESVIFDCGVPAYDELQLFPLERPKDKTPNFVIGDFVGVCRYYVGTNDIMLISYKIIRQPDLEHVVLQQAVFS